MSVIDLCAQLTRGAVKGSLEGKPTPILYITQENSREESMAPRAMAAGAAFERFFHWGGDLSLPGEIDVLRSMISKTKAKLCVLDTLGDYITLSIQNSQQNAKKALQPIATVAEQTGCAIVLIFWANKSGKGTNAVAGSVGNSGTARNVIVVGQLSTKENVIGTIKANDGRDHFGFVYGWDLVTVEDDEGNQADAPKITWDRIARPSEIDKAQEQLTLTDDPRIVPLLEYMAEDEKNWTKYEPPKKCAVVDENAMRGAGWFFTDELLGMLQSEFVISESKARQILNSAHSAVLLARYSGGQGQGRRVAWRINDLGRSWIKEEDDTVMGTWFHTDAKKRRPTSQTSPVTVVLPTPKALTEGVG